MNVIRIITVEQLMSMLAVAIFGLNGKRLFLFSVDSMHVVCCGTSGLVDVSLA